MKAHYTSKTLDVAREGTDDGMKAVTSNKHSGPVRLAVLGEEEEEATCRFLTLDHSPRSRAVSDTSACTWV